MGRILRPNERVNLTAMARRRKEIRAKENGEKSKLSAR